jgi:hypothetical protein
VAVGLLFWFPSIDQDLPRWLFYIFCLAALIVLSQVQKYYGKRFGVVESNPRQLSTFEVIAWFAVFIGFLVFCAEFDQLDLLLQKVHRAIGDPDFKVRLLPLGGCIFLLSARFRKSLGLWRSDRIFLTVGVLFYGVVVFTPLTHPQITNFAPWRFVVKYWASLLFIATGLYDHCLLVRFFPRRAEEF